MCFSAPASFAASAALALAGTALVMRVRKEPRLLPLMLIPWFFAIQQVAEGVVWLTLPSNSFATTIFLFFAYLFWPIWIPFSLWFAESQPRRKQVLAGCLGIGMILGVILAFRIPETIPTSYRCAIHYRGPATSFATIATVVYAIATLVPLFVSSLKRIWLFGTFLTLSGMIILFIDRFFFVSIWCFFAAVFALSLFFISNRKKGKK